MITTSPQLNLKHNTEQVLGISNLVSFWTFGASDNGRAYNANEGELYPLSPVNGELEHEMIGPYSGASAYFNGNTYLSLDYEKLGALNIHGKDAQVSMFTVVRVDNRETGITIAGIWNEGEGWCDDRGTRQYAMLLNMPAYGGEYQLVPHISAEGGVSYRADGSKLPWNADYAASTSQIQEGEWVSLGFSYDGEYIRAYFNGVMEERAMNPESDKRDDPYFMFEGPDGGYRGMNPYYHGKGIFTYDADKYGSSKNGPSDFTVGARYAEGGTSKTMLTGCMAGLAVFDRCLDATEFELLHESACIDELNQAQDSA